MKKIIISFILVATLLFTAIPFAASAANGATVSIVPSTTTVCPGQTVTLSVTITGNTGFSAMTIIPSIPNGFTIEAVTPTAALPLVVGDNLNPANGAAFCMFPGTTTNVNGVIYTITVRASVATNAPAVFGFTKLTVLDVAGRDLPFNNAPALVTVGHTAGTPVKENVVLTDCALGGTYDEVVYCTVCGVEISRTQKNIAPAECVDANRDGKCDNCSKPVTTGCIVHKTATRTMIVTPATCNTPGAGFTMVYCTVCNQTLSTFPLTIPATNAHIDENDDHKCDTCETVMSECEDADKDGKCDVCGKSLVTEHVHELEHVEAKAATCTENGNIEYWYCAGCDSYFTDAEGKNKVDAADVVVPAAHKVEHVAAKEATETEDGNIEYWHCPECGGIWLDADCTTAAKLEDVVIPATGHVHELVHTEAKEATCFEEGNLEYWYCAGCDCYFTDAEGKYNIAYLSLILPVAHKVEHVAAKAPTCFEEGNIEYWYCTECGYAWLDEFCTKNTNLLAVILPVSHKIVHVEAKAPTATEEGNIEYWYCTECGYAWLDELCTKNTNLKAVILPATGEEINPPTGDASILYIAAVAVIATLGVAVISFKKREEN